MNAARPTRAQIVVRKLREGRTLAVDEQRWAAKVLSDALAAAAAHEPVARPAPSAPAQLEIVVVQRCVLSPRERQVLQLVADGLDAQAMGRALYLSHETVRTHVKNIQRKLKARDRAHAVAIGFRLGLLGDLAGLGLAYAAASRVPATARRLAG